MSERRVAALKEKLTEVGTRGGEEVASGHTFWGNEKFWKAVDEGPRRFSELLNPSIDPERGYPHWSTRRREAPDPEFVRHWASARVGGRVDGTHRTGRAFQDGDAGLSIHPISKRRRRRRRRTSQIPQ